MENDNRRFDTEMRQCHVAAVAATTEATKDRIQRMRNARTVTTVVGNQRIDDRNGSDKVPVVAAAVAGKE
jgi:hypothetical protein